MTTWTIDQAHSEVGFKIKHLVVSTVKGRFGAFEGTLTADDDALTNAKLSFSADVSSIHTNNAARDGHLATPEFFDVAQFPKISFVSKSFTKKDDTAYEVLGDFTMKGVTKEVTLVATFNGYATSADGKRVAAFDVDGTVKRSDFGVGTQGPGLSDEVVLDATIELKAA